MFFEELLLKWYPHTSTAIVKRAVFDKVGLFNERLTRGEDGDLWLRISSVSDIYVVNEDLVVTGGGKKNYGESGLSRDLKKMHQGEMNAVWGAFERNQINYIEYIFYKSVLKLKYMRRCMVQRVRECYTR